MPDKPSIPGLPAGMPDPEAIFDSWWPIIIAVVGGFIYGMRQYMRGSRCTSDLKLEDKVAIITGGDGGIGRHIAEDLAKRGTRVYLACRDEKAGEVVVQELKKKTKNDKIWSLKCDLASFKSVRAFAEAFKKKEDHLHFLVNNAGIMMHPQLLTEDKFEAHLQVNYLGHVLLTHLLYDTLKRSSPSRVVMTTAPAYQLASLDFEDINWEKKEYAASAAYASSKLALVFFTREFAKRYNFEENGIAMNCVIPGVVRTGIHRHMPFRQSSFISLTFAPFLWYLMKCPEDGAQTTIFCCLADGLTTVSGFMYKECKREPYGESVENEELQDKVWSETLQWLKIKEFGQTE
ncbi:RDH13-like protein [Mya arenaria]|uniref:RDH13-like protein n=1 Tax=Mya arenaria TaxID=6604 RepID=A0ABY7FCK9_MYAAR|nr:retinol dehydrogenase 12-like [Mya arenaria]WAR19870.1 RDH13-like protein [Mya arenaria]